MNIMWNEVLAGGEADDFLRDVGTPEFVWADTQRYLDYHVKRLLGRDVDFEAKHYWNYNRQEWRLEDIADAFRAMDPEPEPEFETFSHEVDADGYCHCV